MERESLQTLYVDQLQDLYSAEQQILKALPKMAQKASNPELRSAFTEHEKVTRVQVDRLDKLFEKLGEEPGGHECVGMKGLLAEGDEAMKEHEDPDVRDAAMIAAAQRVEHYEIAGYGVARTFANQLGLADQADVLQKTLDEEGATDHRLTAIAETVVNLEAMKAD